MASSCLGSCLSRKTGSVTWKTFRESHGGGWSSEDGRSTWMCPLMTSSSLCASESWTLPQNKKGFWSISVSQFLTHPVLLQCEMSLHPHTTHYFLVSKEKTTQKSEEPGSHRRVGATKFVTLLKFSSLQRPMIRPKSAFFPSKGVSRHEHKGGPTWSTRSLVPISNQTWCIILPERETIWYQARARASSPG